MTAYFVIRQQILVYPFICQDLIVNFPLWPLHISLYISHKSLVLDPNKLKLQLDKFKHYHLLFVGERMHIIGRR